MLAVVEDEQHLAIPQRLHQLQLSGGITNSQGQADRSHQTVGIADVRELDQPDPVRTTSDQASRLLDSQAGLTHSTNPDERHQAVIGEQPSQLGQLLVPTHERTQVAGQVVARHSIRGDCGDRSCVIEWGAPAQFRLLQEDSLLQSRDGRAGLYSQLFAEQAAEALKRSERVTLPVRTVQGEHERRPQTLLEWQLCNRCLCVGHDAGVITQLEAEVKPVLHSRGAQPVQARRLARRPTVRGHVSQRRPPPALQAFLHRAQRVEEPTRLTSPFGLGHVGLELRRLRLVVGQVQHISAVSVRDALVADQPS